MKKLITGFFLAALALTLVTAITFAGQGETNASADAFIGTFTGTVAGDKGSETTITLDIDSIGHTVTGNASLGRGLIVDAGGFCGAATLPATSMRAEGVVSASNPDELTADATIDVGNFEVKVEVTGELSADGESMELAAEIDTPWLCGRDPVITGTLTKVT